MRIVSGSLRGKRLNPTNLEVRPTTDFAKESLFNILRNRVEFEQCSVLDLFSGTGSISFEFLSRGVKQCVCVEQNDNCVKWIKRTAEQMKLSNLLVLKQDVFKFLGFSKMNFDIVFADPPYDLYKLNIIPDLVLKSFVKENGIFILEHSQNHSFKEHPLFSEQREYGKVNFTFFQK